MGVLDWKDIFKALKGKTLGKRIFEVVTIVRPKTLLFWHRKLVAMKFDSSQSPHKSGRPCIELDIEKLVLEFAGDNLDWGYLRIAGAIANLGHNIKSVARSIMKRNSQIRWYKPHQTRGTKLESEFNRREICTLNKIRR